MRPAIDSDVCARAMSALDAELALPAELEARMLDAAVTDPAERAMDALDQDLSIPKDIESRLLAAIPPLTPSNEATLARDPDRPPPSRVALKTRRRGLWISLAAALALGGSALALWGSGQGSTRSTSTLEPSAQRTLALASSIDWNDKKPWAEKMAVLEELRKQIELLRGHEETRLLAPTYVDGIRKAFLDTGTAALEGSVSAISGHHTFQERAILKEYLLLGDALRLRAEGAWQATHLTATCADAMAATSTLQLSAAELHTILRPHVVTWIFLVETGLVRGARVDEALVAKARGVLTKVSADDGYSYLVESVASQRRNPELPASSDNLAYPPITLDSIFHGRPEWLSVVHSKQRAASGTDYEIGSAYTGAARRAIHQSFAEAEALVGRDDWVVGDASADARVQAAIAKVREEYDARYIERWSGLLRDLEVAKLDASDAAQRLRMLGSAESPLARILRALKDNTEGESSDRKDLVAATFRPVVAFGDGDHAPLARYSALLLKLADDLERTKSEATPLFQSTAKEANALLAPLDEASRNLLAPLLTAPLNR